MEPRKLIAVLLSLFAVIFFIGSSHGIAVMSIDIGSESMKVAIVSPGVPMEIALNKESKRKTPATIAFRGKERTFGEDAQVVGSRFPQNSFSYILDLLGKPIDHPLVELYKTRFPYYDIIDDDERNTIAFRLDKNTTYTPEELLAQILHKGKEFAQNFAGQRISEAVITVPGFFNQAERRALLQAAELAEIKVLQLINDYTAVSLNYGIFRRKEINDSAQYIMFFDMGASSTTATIVGYQNVKTKEKGFVETNPQVSILGVGYDRTLGGLEMQIRLQRYLAKEFDALKKTPNSVFKSPRAMAKLFKEAGRVKNVLSANADHFAQVEGLLDEQDFRLQVTREKLEDLCSDLFDRITKPIEIALEMSGLTMDIISQVVLVGAATRMPKVQDKLTEFVKIELSKNINTDEAAALGAVYKAADLSQGFKVKKFLTKDAVLFPIQIVFDRTVDDKTKQVRRILFSKMNAYPQKKIITFNKHTNDFEFNVNYVELDHLPPKEVAYVGNLNISVVTLTGVADALTKHSKEGTESKGIKAHFAMDDSGILKLINAELIFEKTGVAVDEEEGTFSKLGSTISKLFAGSDDKEKVEKMEEFPKEDIKPVHEEPEYPGLRKETDEKISTKNETKPSEDKASNKTEKVDKEKKPTVITIKEPIVAKETKLGPQILEGEKRTASIDKIRALELYDLEKFQRESALNNLEAFVIDAQQKLASEEYIVATTSQESEKILKACNEVSNWLYEDGFDATAEIYELKLKELKKLTDDLYERVFEHRERPEALNRMAAMLNGSTMFLNNMQNLTTANEIFTRVEIETLEKVINETRDYYDMITSIIAETPLRDPVKFKVREIFNKMALLDREVKYLVNKAKIWRPKQESVINQTENTDKETIEVSDGSGSESTVEYETNSEKSEEVEVEQTSDNVKTEQTSDHVEAENEQNTEKLLHKSEDLLTSTKSDTSSSDKHNQEEIHQEL